MKTQLSHQEAIIREQEERIEAKNCENERHRFDKNKLRKISKILTVSDPDVSSREYETPRKPLTSAKSNQNVFATPVPTPRRVSRYIVFFYDIVKRISPYFDI